MDLTFKKHGETPLPHLPALFPFHKRANNSIAMASAQRFFVLLQLALTCMAAAIKQAPPYLNITAISAADDASILECWELASPFETSSEPGVAGAAFAQLGDGAAASYAIIPADFDGGMHNAPVVQ